MPAGTIFLDRDGVINRRLPGEYVRAWQEFEFLPGALDALRRLTQAGWRLIVITNQRGIARGLMTEEALSDIHRRMQAAVSEAGGSIVAIYHCPHDRHQCSCRKPEPGMLLQARHDFPDIILAESIFIGDSLSDMQAGQRAGCRALLINDQAGMSESDYREAVALATEGTATSLIEAARRYAPDRQADNETTKR